MSVDVRSCILIMSPLIPPWISQEFSVLSAVFSSNKAHVISRACRAAIDVFSWSFSEGPVKGAQALTSLFEFHAASATEDLFVVCLTSHAQFEDILYVTHLFWVGEVARSWLGVGWGSAGWIVARPVVTRRGERRHATGEGKMRTR